MRVRPEGPDSPALFLASRPHRPRSEAGHRWSALEPKALGDYLDARSAAATIKRQEKGPYPTIKREGKERRVAEGRCGKKGLSPHHPTPKNCRRGLLPLMLSPWVSDAYPERVSGDNIGDVGEVTLNCDPVGGTHPHAREACAAIEEAGAIARTQGYGGMCPDVYDPVYATAEGLEKGFTNHCFLLAERGVVFDF